jgi:phage gpG-like protein
MRVTIEYDRRQLDRGLRYIQRESERHLRAVMERLAEAVIARAQGEYLNAAPGPSDALHSDTGLLSSSMQWWWSGGDLLVGSRGVVYARIHEFGGVIRARQSRYLRFQVAGRWVTTESVRIPQRSFVHRPFEDVFFRSNVARRLVVAEAERMLAKAFPRGG